MNLAVRGIERRQQENIVDQLLQIYNPLLHQHKILINLLRGKLRAGQHIFYGAGQCSDGSTQVVGNIGIELQTLLLLLAKLLIGSVQLQIRMVERMR